MNHRNHGNRWTDHEDGQLRALAEQGMLLPAIARDLGRTQESIRTRANILGIPVRSSEGRTPARLNGTARRPAFAREQ